MELTAVIKALEYIEIKHAPLSTVQVFSDSQYVCKLPNRMAKIIKTKFKTKIGNQRVNSDLLQILFAYLKKYQIHFIKLKAHTRDETSHAKYNRKVDKLARSLARAKNEKNGKIDI